MKKVLSLVSVTLSLVLIAATILVVPTFAASGSTVGENLLANPEFNYTDNGDGTYTVDDWTITSPTDYLSHSVYTENNENIVVLQSINIDKAIAITTKNNLSLSKDKYYKFSVWLKLEAPDMLDSSGNKVDFNCNQAYPGAYMFYKFNGQDAYRSTAIKAVSDWQEYSFIIRGSEVGTGLSSVWDKFCGVKLYGIKGKLSIKKPSVIEYNPDDITLQEAVEQNNMLTGDVTAFSVPTGQTAYVSSATETVELNGETVTALKISTKKTNDDFYSYFWLKEDGKSAVVPLSNSEKYRFSAWIKMDMSQYNEGYSATGIYAAFGHNGGWRVGEKTTTFGEWQKLEIIIDPVGDAYTIDLSWAYRVGIRLTAVEGDLYIANPKLEKFVGDITVSEINAVPQNIVTNGDFEIYDDVAKDFTDWSYFNGNNANNTRSCGTGVSGNAYKFTSADTSGCPTATKTISIDNTLDYKASVMVKAEKSSYDTKWGYAAWGGGIRMTISNEAKTFTASTEALSAETNGWVKLSVGLKDIPQDTTSLKITLAIGSTKADVYFDDITITPVTGGTLNIDRTNANTGDTVYVSAVADEGYYLDSVSYNDGTTDTTAQKVEDVVLTSITSSGNANGHIGNGYSQIASDCVYQFTMPAENITVKAVFKEIIIGDINGDAVVDIRDLVRLALYFGDNTTKIATVNADVDGNGSIEAADVTALRETLLNQ